MAVLPGVHASPPRTLPLHSQLSQASPEAPVDGLHLKSPVSSGLSSAVDAEGSSTSSTLHAGAAMKTTTVAIPAKTTGSALFMPLPRARCMRGRVARESRADGAIWSMRCADRCMTKRSDPLELCGCWSFEAREALFL